MRPLWFAAAALAALLAGPALAQSQAPGTTPVRIAGTIDKLDGAALTLKDKDGAAVVVTLANDASVYGVEKRTLADIKSGDFVASGGVKGSDGQIHAVEVRIFPPSLRGTGEGQRPWNVKPGGVMTNATVGTLTQSPEGGIIHVAYKGGESEYRVDRDVPILAYVDADRSLLKPGATVLIFAQKQPDGTLTTSRVTAEKDGVKPPI